MSAEKHDLIVIGSGFGGATAAARLVDAGARVTLLERGPWRQSSALERSAINHAAPLPRGRHLATLALRRLSASWGTLDLHHDGLFDVHYQRDLSMVCSSSVGGGSHVYSAMNTRPAVRQYWQGHHQHIDEDTLAPHYDWILNVMGSRRVADSGINVPNYLPDDPQRPDWMVTNGVEQPALGMDFQRGRLANNSFFGSADNNKVTLDTQLLLPRLAQGLSVRDRHEVLDLAATRRGFRLAVRDHVRGRYRTLLADRVVLAAGTLNTLRLLFAARARGSLKGMPALGLGIGGNGDVPAWWSAGPGEADYTLGTPSHGRFALADFADCPDLSRYGLNGLPGFLHPLLKRQLVLVGMGADQANGLASWHRGQLQLHYSRNANPVLERIYRAFDEIGRRSGRPVRYLRQRPITVHPLGGARLGADPLTSVTNADGQVHDIPGLYICDASALPAAPGSPPSMTIAAWAGHVASQLAQTQPQRNHRSAA